MIGPSIKNLKAVVEELKKTGVSPIRERFSNGVQELRKENLEKNEKTPNPEIDAIERPALQKGEMKIAETALSDLIQERMELEKVLQEINNLKGRICQRIGLLKMLEKGKKEIERAPNFLEETKNKLDNLKGHIK